METRPSRGITAALHSLFRLRQNMFSSTILKGGGGLFAMGRAGGHVCASCYWLLEGAGHQPAGQGDALLHFTSFRWVRALPSSFTWPQYP